MTQLYKTEIQTSLQSPLTHSQVISMQILDTSLFVAYPRVKRLMLENLILETINSSLHAGLKESLQQASRLSNLRDFSMSFSQMND